MGEGGGKDRRRAVACAIESFCEKLGILIGGIKVGRYSKITCAGLAKAFGLNGSITAVTCKVDNFLVNDKSLDATLTLT